MKKRIIYKSIKYKLDVPLAAIIFLLVSPLMLVIFLILLLELKAFPFMVQARGISLDNCRLRIYKFRTIKKHYFRKSKNVKSIFEKNYLEEYVPPFCRWLRKSGLDELPQLYNVIKGEMSLIGPRPLTLGDLQIIQNEDNDSYKILDNLVSRPGITGCWQVFGSRKAGIANLISLQKYYDLNVSLPLDIKILIATIPIVVFGRHSDAIVRSGVYNRRGVYLNSLNQG